MLNIVIPKMMRMMMVAMQVIRHLMLQNMAHVQIAWVGY